MKKLTTGTIAVLLVCILSGCGGLLLLASSFLAVGGLAGTIADFFDRPASDYSLYIDGYNTAVHPEPSGALNMTGLPIGLHLLSVVSSNKRVGFHTSVDISEGSSLNLATIGLVQGSLITGKVERATGVPLAGVRVAAIQGGGSLLAAGQSPLQLPTGSGQVVVMGFTDASGNYTLGPIAPGNWLVTAAAAGLHADAVVVNGVATGVDGLNVNLTLSTDDTQEKGTLSGTVTREGGGALADALLATDFIVPFTPSVSDTRQAALQSQIGGTLMTQPWFQWHSLATTTSSAGAYNLQTATGLQAILAFKYGYRAKYSEVTVTDAQALTADFALPTR